MEEVTDLIFDIRCIYALGYNKSYVYSLYVHIETITVFKLLSLSSRMYVPWGQELESILFTAVLSVTATVSTFVK